MTFDKVMACRFVSRLSTSVFDESYYDGCVYRGCDGYPFLWRSHSDGTGADAYKYRCAGCERCWCVATDRSTGRVEFWTY